MTNYLFRVISIIAWVGLLCLILFMFQINRLHFNARCDVQAEQLAEIQSQTPPTPEKHYLILVVQEKQECEE